MNILIVDDEISAIEAVQKGIQWDKLGIHSLFRATSMQEATQQLHKHQIDIMLSDIEMPRGTGLDLLKWINEHHMNVKCIFMTCHADFYYLQEAMKLGSIDYILKPLDFSNVEQIIKSTVEKIRVESILKENSHSWIQNKKTVVKQFWKDFFLGEISPNKDSLTNYFRQKRLDFSLDNFYLPVLIVTKRWTEPLSKDDQKLLHYALRNITEELFEVNETEKEVLSFSETTILIMLAMDENIEKTQLPSRIKDKCQEVMEVANKYVKQIVCCYIGVKDVIYEMPSVIESLQEMDFNNVIYEPRVSFLHEAPVQEGYYAYSDNPIGRWREMVQQGRYSEVLNEIKLRVIPNRNCLKKFTRDFHYLIFGFANDHHIFINELVNDEDSNRLLEAASESLDGLLEWVNHAMNLMQNFDKMNANRDKPVERTKNFIDLHLSEEISMEQISKNVHLNPDYLTRIFKKEVGLSISKYMINKKMEKAKDLLINTDKSIGEVAMLVGYYNYSSFNRIFTKEAGMSPQDFKRSNTNR